MCFSGMRICCGMAVGNNGGKLELKKWALDAIYALNLV